MQYVPEKSLLVALCERYERDSGTRNRVTQAVLTASEQGVDLDKLLLCNIQASQLLAGGHNPSSPEYDRRISNEQYLTEMRQSFDVERKAANLKEAGPWTSGLVPFEFFTGPVPLEYRKLIPPDAYEGAQWKKIVTIANIPNFKLQTRLRREDLGRYAAVPEAGEYNTSAIESYRVFYRVFKYGLTVSLTWEMIVNDDLDAFNDLMRQLVLSGLDSINAYVWGTIVGNPAIWTGNTLFNLNHNNLMGLALSVAALGIARAMMNRHVSAGGKPITGINPAILVIPPELEQTADIILDSSGMPTAQMSAGVVNPERGKLEKLMTRYLVDVDDWYLWATPGSSPVMEMGFLFGQDTPTTDMNEHWEDETIHYRGKFACGHAFVGYKGALLSTITVGSS